MKRTFLFLSCVAALAFSGCASSQTPESTVPAAELTPARGCPLIADTTTVVAEDVDGGAAISFTTLSGDVEALREHAAHLADQHNESHGQGEIAVDAPTLSAASARAEDVDSGARVIFDGVPDTDLEALRREAAERAELIASGSCPMRAYHAAQ